MEKGNAQAPQTRVMVWTEGKTDWKHLKTAVNRLGISLPLDFRETETDVGKDALLRKCRVFAESPQPLPMIFLFDPDDAHIVREVTSVTEEYKDWGNNVFSLALPIPEHRRGYRHFCIEFYYSDDELKTIDSDGRRLYLTSEFSQRSGCLKDDSSVHVSNVHKLKALTTERNTKIVDSAVYRGESNLALSKSAFAQNVHDCIEPFSNFDFSSFQDLFDIIERIILVTRPEASLWLPDIEGLKESLNGQPLPQQLMSVFDRIVSILSMTLQLFIACTIRCYEHVIIDEPPKQLKNARFIKKWLLERYTHPSLVTQQDLARYCYHLIDNQAPDELLNMKECLGTSFRLGAIGQLLEQLELVIPPDDRKARIRLKPRAIKGFLDYSIKEIAAYASKSALRTEVESSYNDLDLDLDAWLKALRMIIEHVDPIMSQVYVLESLTRVDTATNTYTLDVQTYRDERLEHTQRAISFDELEQYETNKTVVLMNREDAQLSIHVFPFLVIKDHKLHFYKRTRLAGYEYHSICDSGAHVVPTRRKFNHTVFRTSTIGAQQSLFWTEIVPATSPTSGIRANIPSEGVVEFVGRRRQMSAIRQEILEIPNQNGIVYGLGGVGKTALMIQLTRELFDEDDPQAILFENIIWISAKSNYYDPSRNLREERRPEFESLSAVVGTILDFFGHQDLDEYSFEDRRWFLLELLKEKSILLVLDNFETIAESEAEAIVRFFEVEVKRALRTAPERFKVIITSRKQVPGGFHHIQLGGLNLRESKQLLKGLYGLYRHRGPDLSEEQKEELHRATFGIPILIKHCFGQIYEYGESFDAVVRKLSAVPNEAVDFSFEEVLRLLSSDVCSLEIILLLELINCPLQIRQLSDILGKSEYELEGRLPTLLNFQCVKRINQGRQEKYAVNDEIRMLTRRLVQEHTDHTQDIRKRITKNFTVEKQMDYTTEELGILSLLNSYLSEKQYLEAERFIESELEKRPESILLKMHYAKFLQEHRRETAKAIEILESIREEGKNHASILRLLVTYHMSQDTPNYDRAYVYVQQLENVAAEDEDLRWQIAEFYARWSIYVKMNRDISPDPIEEMLRQQRYKELARQALCIFAQLDRKDHQIHYYRAQCYFNLWDYENAFRMITTAISLCGEDPRYHASYLYLRSLIIENHHRYTGNWLADD